MAKSVVELVRITIPGRPVPASRPKVTKNGTYYPQRYRDWLDTAKVYARQAWLGKEPLTGPVMVGVVFAGARSNADTDNLLKGVLDALTGTIIRDDRQVTRTTTERVAWRYTAFGEPGTHVVLRSLSGAGTTQ